MRGRIRRSQMLRFPVVTARRGASPSALIASRNFSRFLPPPAHTAAMLKRVQITLAVVLVTLAGVMGWQGLRLREPVYQGRRLSDWLAVYKMDGLAGVESWQVRVEQQNADEAVRHAGTNALPLLLRMLRVTDSALKIKNA